MTEDRHRRVLGQNAVERLTVSMDFTDQEAALVLAGLFELTITHVEDDEKRERCKALVRKLGGEPGAMFYEP